MILNFEFFFFNFQAYLESSVSFLYFSWLNDLLWLLYLSLKYQNETELSKYVWKLNLIDSMFKSIKGILFLCEDFNINLLDYKLNNHTQHFVDLLFSLSLFPLINRPTRLSNQHASIIDNIFTNAINKNINCGIIMEDISDHIPIFCISELDVKKPLKNNNELFYRENTNDNIKKLNNFLTLQNWQTVYNAYNVNESYINFFEIFLHLYNLSCPIRHCK